MRDILLALVILGILPVIFRHPSVGAYAWAWVSLMNPQTWAYGFSQTVGFAQVVAIVTLLALALTRKRYPYPLTAVTVIWLCLVAWMCFTSLFSLNPADLVLERWISFMKIQLMLIATIVLLRSRAQLETLIWVVTFSIAFYGIKGGIWTVLTGGFNRVWGPAGTMLMDNNALSAILVMLMPFLYYLHQISSRKLVRWLLVFSIATCCFAVLGSQSRGAFVAVVTMAVFFALKSHHRVRLGLALAVLLAVGAAFMPDSWTGRMNTMRDYQEEGSAMSRIYSWHTLWNLAVDRPLVGGGFRSDSQEVFEKYAPVGPEYEMFRGSYWVAHSIYFQMLGEHGFVGLGLFLLLGIATWRRAGQLARASRDDPEFRSWVPTLMSMVQVSLIAFGAGGAFLSLAYFDIPYYVVVYVVVVDAIMRSRKREKAAVASPRPTPTSARGLRV